MKQFRQILSLFLVIAMLCGMMVFPVSAEETVTSITGGETISADGTYQLASDATGTITVAAGVESVTIIGNGAEWDEDPASDTHGAISSTPNSDLMIDCSAAPGVTVTLRDLYISNASVSHNTMMFSGEGNTLVFDGTVVLDHDNNAQGYASIHVPTGTDLTIYGTTGSRAYLYKREQAAGIGGNSGEACGEITFGLEGGDNDFYVFAKGSKQGAVIGNGANCSDVPGNITFNSGIYNLMGVARGAIISGSAGASSEDAGNVFVNGGLINFNVDYSGAAIGGGGYSEGNDKGGGALYVSGGSIRTFIDSNAADNGLWSSYGVTECGVNDAAITAARLNAAGEDVYLLTVDTAEADAYTIEVDGETFYEGPRYSYSYYLENANRDTDGDGNPDLATVPQGTPGNWVIMDEPCFYLYVTGEDHVVTVNGEETTYAWDAETKTFSAQAGEEETYAYAWYGDGSATEYTISTAEELAQFAAIVNGTDENYDQDTFLGKTVTLGADIDLSAVCGTEAGTWNAIGGAAENVTLAITSQEELDAALLEYNIIYDDTGWSYKYGTDKNLPFDENRTYYIVVGQIFSGTFDGNGKTISNLYVLSTTGYAGLFGNVDGTLKNFTVTGSVTTATSSTEVDFVGGVTGKLSEGGRIERVTSYVDVDASAKAYNVGGIAGFNGTKDATASNAFTSANNTFIIECVNYGSVYGWSQVGGIAGENAGQILRCANFGYVDALKSGSKAGIGGIAGRNGCNNTAYTAGTIIDCYNFGAIATSDNKWVGGIAGFNNAASTVRNCYNVGTVQGAGQANALVGQNEGTGSNGVYNCWYQDSTKVFDTAGVYGGTYADCGPKTEAEMKEPLFAAILGESFNVDSDNINQGYPVLAWQGGSEAPVLYTVTMPESDELFVVSYTDSTTVAEGGSFSFKVFVTDGYTINSVKANDTVLTANGGTYTIENITSDVTVTISVSKIYVSTWYTTDGTDFVIDTADELIEFAQIVNGTHECLAQDNFAGKTVTLAADIVLAADGLYTAIENVTYGTTSWPLTVTQYVISADAPVWTPIGSGTASGNTVSGTANAFAGTFDGAGYTVSGIYTGTTDAASGNTVSVQGLFGIVTGTVKNVTVSGCITGNSVVGGVAAYLNGGTIENCVNNAIIFSDGGTTPNGRVENGSSRGGATGGIVGLAAGTGFVTDCVNNATVICANTNKGGRVGGIVGLIDQTSDAISVSRSVNNGSVDGYQYVGGIVGMNYAKNSPIDSCVNNGKITFHSGGKSHAGGIVGQFDCIVSNCYNTGDIFAANTVSQEPKYFGGIAGDYVYNIGNGKVINCYSTGTVTYAQNTCSYAGIVLGDGPQSNCYYLDTALAGSGSGVVTDRNKATAVTADELKGAAIVNLLGDAWKANCGGYPVLSWQEAQPHVMGEVVVENEVHATCTTDGSYDKAIYCDACHEELSRVSIVTTAAGHSFGEDKQCRICGAVTGWSGDLTWILDDGTLTFYGEGKMKNYTWKSAIPWYDYRESVTTVVLPEGVTRISGYAFYGMTNLVDIDIPSTVTVIGDYAFKNCASLTEIVLPEGLLTIGDSAFYGTGLTSVVVPASVAVLNEYAFKGCASLTAVTLNEGLTTIGEAAFYACPALTEVVLPSTVTEIGGYAFKNCSALAAVTLNEGLEAIGASAFYGCSALTEIVIPATVTSIEEYAFAHCTALVTIDIQGEPVIGEYAFKNVPGYNA